MRSTISRRSPASHPPGTDHARRRMARRRHPDRCQGSAHNARSTRVAPRGDDADAAIVINAPRHAASVLRAHQQLHVHGRVLLPRYGSTTTSPSGSALGPDADFTARRRATSFRFRRCGWPRGWAIGGEGCAGSTSVRGFRRSDKPTSPSQRPCQGSPRRGSILGDASAQLLSVIFRPLTLRIDAARINNVNNVATTPHLSARVQLIATYALNYP